MPTRGDATENNSPGAIPAPGLFESRVGGDAVSGRRNDLADALEKLAGADVANAQMRTTGKTCRTGVDAAGRLNDAGEYADSLAAFDAVVDQCKTKDARLASQGVANSRMTAKWYGSSQPKYPNDSRENQAKNRRDCRPSLEMPISRRG